MRRASPGRGIALAVGLAWAVAAPPAGAGEIVLAEKYPLRGSPAAVTVHDGGAPVSGAVIEVLYRPNSQTSHTETLAATRAGGEVEWVPRDAGIVTLTARAPGAASDAAPLATLNVAVRYGSFPGRGILIMVVAGVLLFGGAALGFWLLLSARPPAVEPPST